jgi:hypothetical protein
MAFTYLLSTSLILLPALLRRRYAKAYDPDSAHAASGGH